MIVELLASDMPAKVYRTDSELAHWQRELGVGKPRFDARAQPAADVSHPAMAVNLDACIQCTRCVRACREEQVNDVIGYAVPRRSFADRLRPRRSNGPIDMRGLR